MRQLNIDLSDKEFEIVELMVQGKTAEQVINLVLKDWIASNISRMHENAKTLTEKIDEIITVNAQKVAEVEGDVVVK